MRLSYRSTLLVLATMSALALAVAFISQYYFGLHPCHLCVVQRYPYMVVLMIGLLGSRATLMQARWLLVASGACFAMGSVLAGYHTGVELGWFPGPASCTSQGGAATVEELRAQILQAPLVACDQPQAYFLGLTMAAWNALLSFALTVTAFWKAAR